MVVLRALIAGRWLIGAMLLPYILVIGRGEASGGLVGALGLVTIVLYALACMDQLIVAREDEQRLCLIRCRGRVTAETLSVTRLIIGALATLLAMIALLVEPWIGLTMLAVLVLLRVGLAPRHAAPNWILLWIEFMLPLAALVIPFIMARAYGAHRARDRIERAFDPEAASAAADALPPAMGHGSGLAVLLGALMLSAYLLMCTMRDEHADRGAGLHTTVTRLGRGGSSVIMAALALAAGCVAIAGASSSCWTWMLPVLIFALGQLALWSAIARAERLVAPCWAMATVVAGVVVLTGTA